MTDRQGNRLDAGEIPDVLALCRNHLSDQKQKLEQIAEGLRAT